MIDTGMGDKYDEKNRAIYKLDHTKFTLLASLAEKNLKPEDITHVIQTHLHFDHCGGMVSQTATGEFVPTFPNATIFVQRENLKWAQNPTDKDRASYLKQDWEAIIANDMFEELDGPGVLFPGISLRIFNGHTRAQQLPLISDGAGNSVFFCADLFPTKAHVNLPWIMGYDNFPLTTLEEKRKLLPEAFEDKWQLFFEHDPASSFTKIELIPGRGLRLLINQRRTSLRGRIGDQREPILTKQSVQIQRNLNGLLRHLSETPHNDV